jgi:single-strand DNA-binding protein
VPASSAGPVVVRLEAVVLEPHITVVGNVGAPPRTRVLASGQVVTDFRIASTPRRLDKATGAWTDRETIWFGVSCWRQLAEHVGASLRTGDRVVVTGTLRAHTWKTEQGEERSGLEVDAQTVGFDLSRGRAVQERSVPLTVTRDPGVRPDLEVDVSTGEVLTEPDEAVTDDLAAEEPAADERVTAVA